MSAEISRLFSLGQCIRLLTTTDRLRVPHRGIVTAIRSGDPAQAEAVMRRHIEGKLLHDLPQLREKFGDGPVRFDAADKEQQKSETAPAEHAVAVSN